MKVLPKSLEDGLPFEVLENAGVLIFLTDPDGNLLYMNKFAEEASGYSKQDFEVNQNFWELLFNNKETGIRLKNICCTLAQNTEGFHSEVGHIVTRSRDIKRLSWSLSSVCP